MPISVRVESTRRQRIPVAVKTAQWQSYMLIEDDDFFEEQTLI